ncbi:UNVERIFIED_CONTAM: hypothetical protein H355_005462 [Colinus virginianus]|nr:hypothetical protein H355_005462 [Colinus virginianus]
MDHKSCVYMNSTLLSLEPAEGEEIADCWAIAFGDAHESPASAACVASGYDNGDVKLFDMRMGQLQWDTNVDFGVCHLQFDRKDIPMNKMAISCLEGQLFMADMRTLHPEEGYAKKSQKVSESRFPSRQKDGEHTEKTHHESERRVANKNRRLNVAVNNGGMLER